MVGNFCFCHSRRTAIITLMKHFAKSAAVFATNLPDFTEFDQRDRARLTEDGLLGLILLRFLRFYNEEANCLEFSLGFQVTSGQLVERGFADSAAVFALFKTYRLCSTCPTVMAFLATIYIMTSKRALVNGDLVQRARGVFYSAFLKVLAAKQAAGIRVSNDLKVLLEQLFFFSVPFDTFRVKRAFPLMERRFFPRQ